MSQNSKKKALLPPCTRRQWLAMTSPGVFAAMASPVGTLISGLVDGIIQTAQADALPSSSRPPRKYVALYMNGGAPRWVFDGVLCPYSSPSELVKDPSINTRFQNTGGTTAGFPEYATVPITRQGVTLNMPHLWSLQIPTPGGGWVPMASLLDNMVIMRGIDMITDGHKINTQKQTRPVVSAPSLDGMVADRSNTILPAVGAGYYGNGLSDGYHSARGVGIATVTTGHYDALSSLLMPFDRSGDIAANSSYNNYLTRRNAFDLAIKQALSSLGAYAKSNNAGAENLYAIQSRAESMLKKGLGDVTAVYTSLVNKYRALIQAVAASPMPGLTDKPITSLPPRNRLGVINQTLINPGDGKPNLSARNADLATLINGNTNVGYIAETMAIAEYLILNGYSSSVLCNAYQIGGLYCEDQVNMDDGVNFGTGYRSYGGDEHYGGSWTSLLAHSFYFRVISACLYEFISVLKANNLFSETVIHITSEFNRLPLQGINQGMGTDHAPEATVNSIISGAIDKPYVLGNCYLSTDRGSYGVSAPVNVDGASIKLGIGHSTSTIAQLLRVDHPAKNNSTLLIEKSDGSGVFPTIDLATNKPSGVK